MDNNTSNVTSAQQTRAYAGYYGLWVGACWIASFGLNIAGLQSPLLGNLGLLVGLASVFLGVKLLRGFREHVAPLPLRRAWYLSWMMYLAAALLCTAAQYIYFAYLDGGMVTRAYTDLLQQPEVQDLLRQMLPGQDAHALATEAINTFMATPPSQLAIQFLMWNILLATLVAFPTALFSFSRPKSPQQQEH